MGAGEGLSCWPGGTPAPGAAPHPATLCTGALWGCRLDLSLCLGASQ